MSNMDRSWMYRRLTPDGYINLEFAKGVQHFIEYASSQPAYMDGLNYGQLLVLGFIIITFD